MEDVKVLKVYRDNGDGLLKKEGETFQLPKARAEYLAGLGYVEVIGAPLKEKVAKAENKAQDMSMDRVKRPDNKAEKKFSTKVPETPATEK